MDLLNPLDLTPYKFETYWLDNTYQIVLLELSSDTVLKKENYQVHTVYDLYNKPRDFINFASVKNHVIKAAINQLGAVSGKHCYVYRVTYALEHKKNIRGKIVHHDSEESYYHHILDDLILFDSQSDHQKYHQEHGIPFCDFITPRKKTAERQKRIKKETVNKIIKLKKQGLTYRAIEKKLNVSSKTISSVLNSDKYKNLPPLRKAPEQNKRCKTSILARIQSKIASIKNSIQSSKHRFEHIKYYKSIITEEVISPKSYYNTC